MPGKAHFVFSVNYIHGDPHGQMQLQVVDENIRLTSHNIDWLVIDKAGAQFEGTGTISYKKGIYTYRVSVVDKGIHSFDDQISITIWKGTDTDAEPIYKALNQKVLNGDIRINRNSKSVEGREDHGR
jgi:hypothetical protein